MFCSPRLSIRQEYKLPHQGRDGFSDPIGLSSNPFPSQMRPDHDPVDFDSPGHLALVEKRREREQRKEQETTEIDRVAGKEARQTEARERGGGRTKEQTQSIKRGRGQSRIKRGQGRW